LAGTPWWTVGLGAALGALVAAGSVVLGRRQRRRFTAGNQEPVSPPGRGP
jgi:hypothetical protein